MKDYSILDELVPKTQELHRAIFDKGYEQGQKEKTGYWIDDYKNEIDDEIDAKCIKHFYRCSKCGKYADYFVDGIEDLWDIEKPNFCPNCGRRMRGERMTQFVILSKLDMSALCDDKPVDFYIDNKRYVLCTDEYYEKQINQKVREKHEPGNKEF